MSLFKSLNSLFDDFYNRNININNNYSQKQLYLLASLDNNDAYRLSHSYVYNHTDEYKKEQFLQLRKQSKKVFGVQLVELFDIIYDDSNEPRYIFKVGDKYYCQLKEVNYCKSSQNYFFNYDKPPNFYYGKSYLLCRDESKKPFNWNDVFNVVYCSKKKEFVLLGSLKFPFDILMMYEFNDETKIEKARKLYLTNLKLFKSMYKSNCIHTSKWRLW